MQKLTHDSIQQLLETGATPKVTIYIPLEASASPPNITENQIRLKNLVRQACDQLPNKGKTAELRESLCAFLDKSFEDLEFWKGRTHGLMITAAGADIQLFDLPVETQEYVAIDDEFHLAPILALLGEARDYYVLALAQHHPKVYQGDMYGLAKMEIGLPATLKEGLGIDEISFQSEHQGSASGASQKTGGFNGRGGSHDLENDDRLRFFHMLDKILNEKLDRSAPLILAGTDTETAEFKELTNYPAILQATISGNHTETRAEELFAMAQSIIRKELINPEHTAAREEYERLAGANPERVARGNEQIIAAAEQGRIDKLLTRMSRNTTDTVQDKIESVFTISFPEPSSSKILNRLALKVWGMKGKVMSLLPHEMPNGDAMVARLRY